VKGQIIVKVLPCNDYGLLKVLEIRKGSQRDVRGRTLHEVVVEYNPADERTLVQVLSRDSNVFNWNLKY